MTQKYALPHCEEEHVFTDSGYRDFEKREEMQEQHPDVYWQITMMPSKHKTLKINKPSHELRDKLEKLKASIRAKAEHPFRVIKAPQDALTGLGQEHPAGAGDVYAVEFLLAVWCGFMQTIPNVAT